MNPISFINVFKALQNTFESRVYPGTRNENPHSLTTRMHKYLDSTANGSNQTRFHPFKCHVISIKSNVLQKLMYSSNESLIQLSSVLKKVAAGVFKYNNIHPAFVYTVTDEIHVGFVYNEYGHWHFNGNVNKTITMLTSYVTSAFHQNCYIDLAPEFYAVSCEFDVDYELLNYIVWRQIECYRNNMNAFYRHSTGKEESHVKLVDVEQYLRENNVDTGTDEVNYGLFIFKDTVETETLTKVSETPDTFLTLNPSSKKDVVVEKVFKLKDKEDGMFKYCLKSILKL